MEAWVMTWNERFTASNGITAVLEEPDENEEQRTVNPGELPMIVVCARDPDSDEDDDFEEDDEDFDYFYDDDDEEDFDDEFDEDLEEEEVEEEDEES
jgi:hypothetical protein